MQGDVSLAGYAGGTPALPREDDLGPALAALNAEVEACRLCPRLVAWREQVAREKRAAYAAHDYWGRPVPGFGDPAAWLLIVGLAPGAHGSNRTGRMFTGDRSGDWLYRSLHRAGLASQPVASARDDGLTLRGAYITAVVRCAPPGNKPEPAEWQACRPFFERELALLPTVRVIVALGGYAFDRVLRVLGDAGRPVPRPAARFGHGVEVMIGFGPTSSSRVTAGDSLTVLASYHPSQQNTFTGKLTEAMLDGVWARAKEARGVGAG
jgi:uracil-DNA glycosylase family 4